ncbi:ATP-binding protein [Candidatus Woesearchaeota archaeon]|nr:ATP-binding protein [Candidatus Woesearchaeota archaeon]
MVKGIVITGQFGRIVVREKSGKKIELGELLVADTKEGKILLQVFNLIYGSQISPQNLELISGMKLEEEVDFDFADAKLRNYILAELKNLVVINKNSARTAKELPSFFSEVRDVSKDDLSFLTKPKNPLFVGNLRSGSREIDLPIYLKGDDVFSHHILIPATTGRGKSNLTSCMLWDTLDKDYCGILVLDPHDEYYGRNKLGLKDHPSRGKAVYYTPKNAPPGARTLKINLNQITPTHFRGVVDWSDAQREALNAYYRKYREGWIKAVVLDKEVDGFQEGTLAVLKRRIFQLLDIESDGSSVICRGVFDMTAGETTIRDIVSELEQSKTVIVDTSNFDGRVEILIGSIIATSILGRYKQYKVSGQLDSKPVISIILEEAPRVLGKEVLEKGRNIFGVIAKEGRKFKVGLTAITQLPSLIPRDILANMNTKIILGLEMKPERQAIIESASQDLSDDDRNIASLDKGEALITSNFARFATPVKIPLFEEFALKAAKKETANDFSGIKL